MIVSASYRTDIPAFHNAWFRQRLIAGGAWGKNPYGSKPYRVSLASDDVDGFVFWTRNPAPFAESLRQVEAMAVPYVVQYTVTGYPKALETGVPPPAHAALQLQVLTNRCGRSAGIWRYDPVLYTSLTPPEWHRANFTQLAVMLSPFVDEVCVSFATIYRKTARNLTAAAVEHGFTWWDPPDAERKAAVLALAEIAADQGLRLTVCSQPELTGSGVAAAACIDVERLSRVAGRSIGAKVKGNRPGCLCAESRDIGAYDTCAHGCRYCYAVADHAKAQRNVQRQKPEASLLG